MYWDSTGHASELITDEWLVTNKIKYSYIRIGLKGLNTYNVQQLLVDLDLVRDGYKPNGYYSKYEASKFQKEHNIPESGIVEQKNFRTLKGS